MTALVVVLGAVVGAPARYLIDRWVTLCTARISTAGELPWGLFTVNVLGSAIAGGVVASSSGLLRTGLLVGLCGTFTTFSGFSWESMRLWSVRRADFWVAVVGMPLACTAAYLAASRFAGFLLG